jgi:hypothetical protein
VRRSVSDWTDTTAGNAETNTTTAMTSALQWSGCVKCAVTPKRVAAPPGAEP